MCGFVGVFEIGRNGENLRAQVLRMSGKIRHRGPDWSGIYCGPRAVLSHERLSIVDPQSGGQPLYSPDGRLVLAVNGEIYNHRELRRELAGEYDFRTGSDCEVILPLYRNTARGCSTGSTASSPSRSTTSSATSTSSPATPSASFRSTSAGMPTNGATSHRS